MTAFFLTRPEAWTLCTLLHLPVQPGSLMSDWLNAGETPGIPRDAGESLQGLAKKAYYDPADEAQPFDQELLACLALASTNAAVFSLVIRQGKVANLTRFAQVGQGLVQFGMDERNLSIHSVTKIAAAAGSLLPAWFAVGPNEGFRAELPLGAFLLFKNACELADIASAESGFGPAKISKGNLLDRFMRLSDWVDIFNAEGVRGVLSVDEMPIEDYYNQLVARGLLEEAGEEALQVGEEGKPLAAAFADPDLCTITVTLQVVDGGYPPGGSFLYGNGRLFLVEAKPGLMIVQQLANLKAGQTWLEKMLAKGSQAHFKEYVLPKVPASPAPAEKPALPAEKAADATLIEPAQLSAEATLIEQRPPSAGILFTSGPLKDQSFPLGEALRLGREKDNDLALADKKASRHHAVIQHKGTRYEITDLDSSNGTFLNGESISSPTLIKHGDTVRIGDTEFKLVRTVSK